MTATERRIADYDDDEKTVIAPPPCLDGLLESDVTRVGVRVHDEVTRVDLHLDDDVTRVSTRRPVSPVMVSVSLGDEPTRVGGKPPVPRALAVAVETSPAEESTKRSRRRPRSPVQIAFLVVALALSGMLTVSWKRTSPALPAHPAAVAKTTTPKSPPTPVSSAVAPLVVVTAPSPDAPTTFAPASARDERPAVEAVASGSYAQAARLYQALAAAHPTNEAYREAARILVDRSKESPR